jgi:hypothetical protein
MEGEGTEMTEHGLVVGCYKPSKFIFKNKTEGLDSSGVNIFLNKTKRLT